MNPNETITRRDLSILAMRGLGALLVANEAGSAWNKTVTAYQRDKLARDVTHLQHAAEKPDADETSRQTYEAVNRQLEAFTADLEAQGGLESRRENIRNGLIAGAITVFGFVAPRFISQEAGEKPAEARPVQTIDTYPANKKYRIERPLRTSLLTPQTPGGPQSA